MGNYILLPNGDFTAADELYHHGIKGMKWGVRRYQNKNGSLTSAGKRNRSIQEMQQKQREKIQASIKVGARYADEARSEINKKTYRSRKDKARAICASLKRSVTT